MGIGLIKGSSLFIDILNKYNISFIEDKESVVVEYSDSVVKLVCVLFNCNKKIYIDKSESKFNFVISKNDFSYELLDVKNIDDDLVMKFIDLLSYCRQIKLSLRRDGDNILLDLFSSQYSCIFDGCLMRDNNYYFVSKSNIFNLEQELNIYNKLLSPIDIKISKRVIVSDFSYIENYYHEKDIEKIIIFNNSDTIDLIMVSDSNVKFVFRNKKNFEKVILPEILKMCSYKISSLDKEEKLSYFNKMFYTVDNQLYMLNFPYYISPLNLYNLFTKVGLYSGCVKSMLLSFAIFFDKKYICKIK